MRRLLTCGTLDDQTQVDSKPAGQPEHASLNQCQLIAANGRQNWFYGHPPADWSLFPRDLALLPYLVVLA